MVVDHAHGLHEGIANGGADEFEAPCLQGLAHGFALRWFGLDVLPRFPCVADRFAADKAPKEFLKIFAGLAHVQIRSGVADCGGNFGAVADDAGVGHQG